MKLRAFIITSLAITLQAFAADPEVAWTRELKPEDVWGSAPNTHALVITNYLPAHNGGILLLVSGNPIGSSEDHFHMVLLNSDGSTKWVGPNLINSIESPFAVYLHQARADRFIFQVRPNAQSKYKLLIVDAAQATPTSTILDLGTNEYGIYSPEAESLAKFAATKCLGSPRNEMITLISPFPNSDNYTTVRKYTLADPNLAAAIVPSASGVSSGNFVVQWNSLIGESYAVEQSTDLTTWAKISPSLSGTGAAMNWATPVTSPTASNFFRVVRE